MAKVHPELSKEHQKFISEQKMFFVASAPAPDGFINLSPKGLASLRIIDPLTLVYMDLTGSGNETAAHVRQNGRLTIMLCSFTGKPVILRIFGRGEIIDPVHEDFENTLSLFQKLPGLRHFVKLKADRVQTSCGFGVPLYEYAGQRQVLIDWAEKKGEQGLKNYRAEKNSISINGIPTGTNT